MSECEVIVAPQGSINGTITIVGLNNDATVTEVPVTTGAWTKVNTLTDGQGINIQNPQDSLSDVKVNFVSPSQPAISPAVTAGMEIIINSERQYVIKTSGVIDVYVRAVDAATTVTVEQLA